jgi:predicted secreted Zn-dependent protease
MDHQSVKKKLLALAFALHSVAASADPIATVKESYYSIQGTTAPALRSQMKMLGPLDNGKHFDAYTKYHVQWRYEFDQSDGACKLTNIHVTVNTNYIYPRWENYFSATSAMQSNWNTYFARLSAHERKHGEHGVNAANEIDTMLSQLPAMTNCNVLGDTANDRAYQILEKYQRVDSEYDQVTNHGINEGVMLDFTSHPSPTTDTYQFSHVQK